MSETDSKLRSARFRAEACAKLRAYFAQRGLLEVETPLLSQSASHDFHLDVFSVSVGSGSNSSLRYLQTSPEPHMKRLLARGYPDIFQIGKAFRMGERGQKHNPEFTLVEWYRRGFALSQMMEETVEVCRLIAGMEKTAFHSYRQIFTAATGMDPLSSTREELLSHPRIAKQNLRPDLFPNLGDVLNYMLSEIVEPSLDPETLTVVHGFPALLASQALPDAKAPGTSLRFEVFAGGMELGNGYEELLDPGEYLKRFHEENGKRTGLGKPVIPLHPGFFADLAKGLPASSGVALGLDRLILMGMGQTNIDSVLDFPWEDG